VTERPKDRAEGAEDPERARIRRMLLERGVPPVQITERLIDFWIVQDAKDQEEGRRLGYEPPPFRWFFGSGA
jgi:hypothetical protein